ncbi:FAD:protein FMN transferase [Bacillus sp. B6(2022)]|nr:FAD:protein FMN transferase [Bacillus sp. B6(2022)]
MMKWLGQQKLITFQKSMLAMGTVINIQVVAFEEDRRAVLEDINRAFSIFYDIEHRFSRFRSDSEVMKLANRSKQEVLVSEMLFDLTAYALELAELTNGKYDPTIGKVMEQKDSIGCTRQDKLFHQMTYHIQLFITVTSS